MRKGAHRFTPGFFSSLLGRVSLTAKPSINHPGHCSNLGQCLELSPEDKRELILDRFVGVPVSNHRLTLTDLMNNQYANYVVQRTFEMSNSVRRGILVFKIE